MRRGRGVRRSIRMSCRIGWECVYWLRLFFGGIGVEGKEVFEVH